MLLLANDRTPDKLVALADVVFRQLEDGSYRCTKDRETYGLREGLNYSKEEAGKMLKKLARTKLKRPVAMWEDNQSCEVEPEVGYVRTWMTTQSNTVCHTRSSSIELDSQ